MAALRSIVQLLLGAAMLTPLVAFPGTFAFGFQVPKALYLCGVVELMLGAWVLLALFGDARPDRRRGPIAFAAGLFLASLGASSLLGVDPHRSVWDTYERMLGLVTMLHYAALFVVATSVLRSWEEWRRMLRLVLVAALCIAGIAVAQKIDPALLANEGNPRVSATLGHPAYLGSFGLFACAVAALLWTKEESGLGRAGALLGGLAGIASILLCEARGSMLGLAAGVVCALLGYALALAPGRPRRVAVALLVCVLAGGLGSAPILGLETRLRELEHEVAQDRAALFLRWHASGPQAHRAPTDVLEDLRELDDTELESTLLALDGERVRAESGLDPFTPRTVRELGAHLFTDEVRQRELARDGGLERRLARTHKIYSLAYSVPGLRRFARSTLTKKTASARILNWEIALDAWRERPWFGWGPNNFYTAHIHHYRAALFEHGLQETWVDNAHNILLNTLAVQGAVGALAYLGLIGTPIVVLWRRRKTGRGGVHAAVVGIAFLVAHGVHGLFVFEDLSSYLSLVFMLAFASWATSGSDAPREDRSRGPGWVLFPVSALVALALWQLVLQPARANLALERSFDHLQRGEYGAAREDLGRFAALDSAYTGNGLILFASLSVTAAGELVERGAAALDPEDAAQVEQQRGALRPLLAHVYDELEDLLDRPDWHVPAAIGRAKLAELLWRLGGDDGRDVEVERELGRALGVSPGRQEIILLLVKLKTRTGRPTDEWLPQLEELAAGAPTSGPGRDAALEVLYNAAFTLHLEDRVADSLPHLERLHAAEPGYRDSLFLLAWALHEGGRFGQAEAHYRALLRDRPDHAQARFNLAHGLLEGGRAAEALVEFERVLEQEPSRCECHSWLARCHEALGDATAAGEQDSLYTACKSRAPAD